MAVVTTKLSRYALALAAVSALGGLARANGRDPYISTINFQVGNDQQIMAGATFGLLRSEDGGQTFRWYCERAIGYGGTYDPDYVYSSTGSVFATTFDGLKVMRDDCSFGATPPGMTFVSHVERGPDGAIYFSASDPNDTRIYKSIDDGMTFPTSTTVPASAGAWWQTLVVAPSDAQRVYLTGYQLPKRCTSNSSNPGAPCTSGSDCIESAPDAGACEAQKEFLLYRSDDGGASFAPMSMTGISQTSLNSAIEIAGVHPTNPDIVFARVTLESQTSGEGVYRSTDGGGSWTKILSRSPNIGGLAFLVRYDGSCVAGTRDIGAWKSTTCDSEASFTEITGAPHIGCLYENSAHEVWACTQNTASVQLGITADGFGIMKSSDLVTWAGVLRFQDIAAPVACAKGTVQQDRCVDRYMEQQSPWCCLVPQLGLTSTAIECTGYMACFGTRDETTTADGKQRQPSSGCCDATSQPPLIASLFALIGFMARRRRSTRRAAGAPSS